MSESREIRTLRMMAWERAKGELRSMLASYWDSPDKYERMEQEVAGFITHVEDHGLHE